MRPWWGKDIILHLYLLLCLKRTASMRITKLVFMIIIVIEALVVSLLLTLQQIEVDHLMRPRRS